MWTNPCTQPIRRSEAVACSPTAKVCPVGSWCHVGGTADTTVCCPGSKCLPWSSLGPGGRRLAQVRTPASSWRRRARAGWRSRGGSTTCDPSPVEHSLTLGCEGTRTTFSPARSASPRAANVSHIPGVMWGQWEGGLAVWQNPCQTPLERSEAIQCAPGGNSCPAGTWCHVGAGLDTTVCCPVRESPHLPSSLLLQLARCWALKVAMCASCARRRGRAAGG